MNELLALFGQMRLLDLADIALVSVIVYQIILIVRGTRAVQMLAGLGLIFLAMVGSRILELRTINWIISSFLSSLIIVIIILFQSDIRKALARLGRGPFFGSHGESAAPLEEVVRAVGVMSSSRTGALIVLERHIGLLDYMEVGTRLDAMVSRGLLVTIFQHNAPLHDGAVFISGERIVAAGCVLPLSANPSLGAHLGTRHRAGVGLSEETDAVSVVVSEERGEISLAYGGRLFEGLDQAGLRRMLFDYFEGSVRRRKFLWRERRSV